MEPTALHGEALLKALVEVAIKVAGMRTVDSVLATAGEGLKSLDLQMFVAQYREGQIYLRYLSRVPSTEFGRQLVKAPVPGAQTTLDAAFAAGKPVFIEKIEEWVATTGKNLSAFPFADAARAVGYGKIVLAPLYVNAVRWGGLGLGSNTFQSTDIPAVALFAAQLHSALEAAEIIEGLEGRNKELEEIHAIATGAPPESSSEQLLRTVAHATRSDSASLHRYDVEANEFVIIGEPFGFEGNFADDWRRFKSLGAEPPGVSVARTAEELPVNATEVAALGYRQLATVVLSVNGRTTGLLSLARRSPEPFSKAQLHTAEILGAQVASLLERARLNAESAKLLRQLKLLYEMTSAGAVVGQINPVMQRLLGQMLDAFPVDGAAIHFVERTQLRLAGYTMRKGTLLGPPTAEYLPIDDASVTGQVCLTRERVLRSVGTFPTATQLNIERLGGVNHLLACPLLVGDRLVGVLSMARKRDPIFTQGELKLAESCAVHIAVILEHLRLYEDLKKSYDELAQTQAALVKHERLAALGELAAVMAHEVRNPLGVIFNSLTSLKRLADPDGNAELLLRIIGEEADRLNRIVGDLLDFARPYEALKKPIALEPILASAVDAAVAAVPASSAKVVTQFPAELPRFQLDAHLVRQAFVNLVVNALQAMPNKGGTVTVRALPEERAGQLWVRVEVRDEGVGISAETAERIFEPFFTTKATGTGLGLAVVKRIIDAHHGEVTVQSMPQGGTTFTIRIPGGVPETDGRSDDDADTQPPLSLVPRASA